MVYSKSSKILLIKSLWSAADNGGKKRKRSMQRETTFFFGSQREIVLEGIWDLEQASCARIGVFSSSLEVQTTWFLAGGGSFRPDYYYAK